MSSLPKRTDKRHRLCAAYPLLSAAYVAAYVHFVLKKFLRFSEKSVNWFFEVSWNAHLLRQGDGGFSELAFSVFVFRQRVIKEKDNHLPS